MREETYTLPSGCQITLRPIMLREENLLADAMKNKRTNLLAVLRKVLDACTIEIADPGPYEDLTAGGRPDWRVMLSGDQFATMIHLRILSYSERETYVVSNVPCAVCGRRDDYEVNLYEDLMWRELDEDGKQHLRTGEPFCATIQERVVQFHQSTGKTEDRTLRLHEQYPHRPVSSGLRARIASVEGVDVAHVMDWLDGGDSDRYPGLTSDEAGQLRDAFDRIDCGIDTEVELTCPDGHEFVIDLPFGAGFLAPAREIQRRRRARRRGKASSEE